MTGSREKVIVQNLWRSSLFSCEPKQQFWTYIENLTHPLYMFVLSTEKMELHLGLFFLVSISQLADVSKVVTYLLFRYLAVGVRPSWGKGSPRFGLYIPPKATLGLRAIPHTPGTPFSPDPRLTLTKPFSPQLAPHEFRATQ